VQREKKVELSDSQLQRLLALKNETFSKLSLKLTVTVHQSKRNEIGIFIIRPAK
jgi:hypothetical protein